MTKHASCIDGLARYLFGHRQIVIHRINLLFYALYGEKGGGKQVHCRAGEGRALPHEGFYGKPGHLSALCIDDHRLRYLGIVC